MNIMKRRTEIVYSERLKKTAHLVLVLAFMIVFGIQVSMSAAGERGAKKNEEIRADSDCDDIPGSEFQVKRRLVEIGESVIFTLRETTPTDRFEIFPRYLEWSYPEKAKESPLPLQWLDSLEHETLPANNVICYTPQLPGNHIARWTSKQYGVEYLYFAVIDQSYLIYRPAIWDWPAPFTATGGPEIHNGGLPLDWCISSDKTDEPYIPRLLQEQKRYGGGIVYGMSSPCCDDKTSAKTIKALKKTVANLRRCGLDVGRTCNAWYDADRLNNTKVRILRAAGFDVIDGYVPRGNIYGVGAPLFPFYIGPIDYRFPSQNGPTNAIACVFDFVGSWHFHGPIGFHRHSAKGSWERAKFYIDLAAREAVLTAKNSGTHNFVTTLVNFESPITWKNYDKCPGYAVIWDEERG